MPATAIASRRVPAHIPGMAEYEDTARRVLRYEPSKLERDRARVEQGFWSKARRALSRVPFLEDAIAAYHCARDPQTPTQVKAILFGALAYFVMPADVVPDILYTFGVIDDAAILAAAYRQVSQHITRAHRERARRELAQLRGDPDDA